MVQLVRRSAVPDEAEHDDVARVRHKSRLLFGPVQNTEHTPTRQRAKAERHLATLGKPLPYVCDQSTTRTKKSEDRNPLQR